MKFWGAILVGLWMYGSVMCLVASAFTDNGKGMVVYGVSTIISGALFKAIFDSL